MTCQIPIKAAKDLLQKFCVYHEDNYLVLSVNDYDEIFRILDENYDPSFSELAILFPTSNHHSFWNLITNNYEGFIPRELFKLKEGYSILTTMENRDHIITKVIALALDNCFPLDDIPIMEDTFNRYYCRKKYVMSS